MLIKVLLFFCYCFSSKSILLSLAPFSLGQAIQINLANKRKQGRASGEKPKSKRRKKHKDLDSKKKSTKSDNKSIQSNKKKTTTCDVCQRNCSTTSNLKVHKRTHTGEKPYPCEVCKKEFARNETLIIHKRTHPGDQPYPCEVCNRKFTTAYTLKNHERTHTGEKPYKCDVCKKEFARNATLLIHKRTHTGEKPFQCHVCERRFNNRSNLMTHNKVHTGKKPFQCHVCLETFTQNGSCKRHLQQQHNINTAVPQDETQAGQESNSTRKEKESGKEPKSKRRRKHKDFDSKKKSTKSDNKSIQSNKETTTKYDVCLKTFNTTSNLKFHKKTQHKKESDVPQEETQAGQESNSTRGDFNQSEAWLDLSYQGALFSVEGSNQMPISHMKDISEGDFNQLEAWLDPSYQGALPTFEGSNPMTTSHMKNISEEETQSGQEANSTRMKAPSEWDLNNIKECFSPSYQGALFPLEDSDNMKPDIPQEKPHKCDVCNKTFTTKQNLSVHKIIHTGEKPHKCDVCPKRFNQMSNLKTHKIRYHNDKLDVLPKLDKKSIQSNKEKTHKCDVCPKRFTRRNHLISHKKTQHKNDTDIPQEKPHKCDDCPKRFNRMSHTGEKPFECHVCHNRFTHKHTLKIHHNSFHNNKPDIQQIEDTPDGSFKKKSDILPKSDNKSIQSNKEKPHTCDVCQRNYSTKYNLILHKKTQHKKKDDPPQEKPHECDVCPKRFNRMSRLISHKRTHTGEKPYKCHVCNQRFTQNSSLTKHNNQYHNIKNHVPQEETQAGQESNSTRIEAPSEFDLYNIEEDLYPSYQGELPPVDDSDQLTTSHMENTSELPLKNKESRKYKNEEWLDPSYQGELPPVDDSDQITTSPMENKFEWKLEEFEKDLAHYSQEEPFSFEGSNQSQECLDPSYQGVLPTFEGSNNILGKEA